MCLKYMHHKTLSLWQEKYQCQNTAYFIMKEAIEMPNILIHTSLWAWRVQAMFCLCVRSSKHKFSLFSLLGDLSNSDGIYHRGNIYGCFQYILDTVESNTTVH